MNAAEWIALAALVIATVGSFIGAYVGARVGLAVLKQRVDTIEKSVEVLGGRSHEHANRLTAHKFRIRVIEAHVGLKHPGDD